MKNFNLDTTDLEQIEAILRNNKNIDRLYTKLCNLDIEDKKNTEEYTKLLEYISIVIEVEDKLYKEANLTIEKALSWAKFLFAIKRKNSFTIREDILRQEYDNRIISRILNNLFNIITKDHNILLNLPINELTNIMTMLGIKVSKIDKKNAICKCITIKNIIENDIYYTFLSFMQRNIEDPKQKMFRENLITAKYNTSFINKEIESYLLTNNFNISTNTYISSDIVSELLLINKELYKRIKDTIGQSIVGNQIYELLEISDVEYSDITKASSSILRQNLMKAAFIFISDEKISDVNYEFHEYIEDKEYQTIHPSHTISENLIKNSFKDIKKNKSKTQILSLN